MTADEILEMQNQGMEIASHTDSHPPLDISGLDEIKREANTSKNLLEDVLGKKVVSFAWPFGGKYKPEVKRIILDIYPSAWNYVGDKSLLPNEPYKDIGDIARVDQGSIFQK